MYKIELVKRQLLLVTLNIPKMQCMNEWIDKLLKWRYDRRSGNCNSSNCKLTRIKKIETLTGFEPMPYALALQCSTIWAMKTHPYILISIMKFHTSVREIASQNGQPRCAPSVVGPKKVFTPKLVPSVSVQSRHLSIKGVCPTKNVRDWGREAWLRKEKLLD